MPELPEVETISRDLNSYLKNIKINSLIIFDNRNFKVKDDKIIKDAISNSIISRIYRAGKSIIWELSNSNSIIFHLRMTGKFIINQQNQDKEKHTMFVLSTEKGQIAFVDIRKFATVDIIETKKLNTNKYLQNIGIDPTTEEFSYNTFEKIISSSPKKTSKQFLLEQNKLVGIGNIYASEILFKAKISPYRLIKTLSKPETLLLYSSVKNILADAIQLRGTTFSDYRDGFNKKGEFQNKLKVYNQNNKNCSYCEGKIKKIKQNGRSTYYCQNCQK